MAGPAGGRGECLPTQETIFLPALPSASSSLDLNLEVDPDYYTKWIGRRDLDQHYSSSQSRGSRLHRWRSIVKRQRRTFQTPGTIFLPCPGLRCLFLGLNPEVDLDHRTRWIGKKDLDQHYTRSQCRESWPHAHTPTELQPQHELNSKTSKR